MGSAGGSPPVASLHDSIRRAVGVPTRSERTLATLVRDLQVVEAGDVTSGLTAVQGTVALDDGTIPAPVTPEDCVYAQYEIRERSTEGSGVGRYHVVEGRVDAVTFLVEDDSGAILVDPTGMHHPAGDRVTNPLDAAGPLPLSDRSTRVFAPSSDGGFDELDRHRLGRAEATGGFDHSEVHVQSTIRPGDEVYVLGDFQRSTEDRPPVVAPTGGPFLVSDLSRSALDAVLARRTADVTGRFVRFLVFGAILVITLLIVGVIAIAIITAATTIV